MIVKVGLATSGRTTATGRGSPAANVPFVKVPPNGVSAKTWLPSAAL